VSAAVTATWTGMAGLEERFIRNNSRPIPTATSIAISV
jgi:hypothetical protein